MILLNFTVRNHKSIRDEVTIDLTRPSLRTLQPVGGDWGAASFSLAGVFGGNATGKSALLDAIRYAFTAIRSSSTTWQSSKSMRRQPFLLDGSSLTSTSSYELDVIHQGRRYLFGFEVDQAGIKREWLRDVPSLRWRTLLDRNRDEGTIAFHPTLRTKIEVTDRELVLSRALLLKNSPLYPFASDLVKSFDMVLVNDSHREARLTGIAHSLAEQKTSFADFEALLQVADIGVSRVSLEENDIPEKFRKAIRLFERAMRDADSNDAERNDAGSSDEDSSDEVGESGSGYVVVPVKPEDDDLEQIVRYLLFTHRGSVEECPPFSIHDESDGTIAWLAIAVPALQVLRQGGLLLVDEIDASLHPHLLEILLAAFVDPKVNTTYAQLVFTSHESYLLSPLSEVRLEPEQVWFTDKTHEGVTELSCLADFPKHPDANVAKRYLTGRYGGTPILLPSLFAALVDSNKT